MGLTASADGMTHLMRVALLDSHVRTGIVYPRWVPELVTGLGYPVFNFYGPSAYYLAETFHLLGLTLVQAMIGAYAVFLVAGGFGMYLLARDIFGATRGWAALIAATAYYVCAVSAYECIYPRRHRRGWRPSAIAVDFVERAASADQ